MSSDDDFIDDESDYDEVTTSTNLNVTLCWALVLHDSTLVFVVNGNQGSKKKVTKAAKEPKAKKAPAKKEAKEPKAKAAKDPKPKKSPAKKKKKADDDDESDAATTPKAKKKKTAPVEDERSYEEIYQKKTPLEHILLRPDSYVGSIERQDQMLWVYDQGVGMNCRNISYVPGLYKIFDEILVNAADNYQRDNSMSLIKVNIDPDKNTISVWNNGQG